MNIKIVLLLVGLNLSFSVECNITRLEKEDSAKKSLQWLYQCLESSSFEANHGKIKINRDHYITIVKEHIWHLRCKRCLIKNFIGHKWNKGLLEIEGAAIVGFFSYVSYLRMEYNNYWQGSLGTGKYYGLLSGIFALVGPVALGDGIRNIRNSYLVEQRINEKLERDRKILALLEQI